MSEKILKNMIIKEVTHSLKERSRIRQRKKNISKRLSHCKTEHILFKKKNRAFLDLINQEMDSTKR